MVTKAFPPVLKNLLIFVIGQLTIEMTNINILGTFKSLLQFLTFFSNGLQMALTMLSRAFTPILNNLQLFQFSHLSAKMTNIKIWLPLIFSYNFILFYSNLILTTLSIILRCLTKTFMVLVN